MLVRFSGDRAKSDRPERVPGGVPYYANPRIAAGEPFTNDVLKCQLKPLDPLDPDYRMLAVPFTPMQWARLQATFPTGVCDWTKPSIGMQKNLPWLTYQDAKGRVIYGGKPMPRAPRSTPLR